MTIEHQANLNRIRNPVLAQLSEEARNVESQSQSRCNSKAWICYGNAIIAITLFIFSFCSIVFIIIFVEYEVIENSIEHHTLAPLPILENIPLTTTTTSTTTERLLVSNNNGDDAIKKEERAEQGIKDAIANRPTYEDDPEEARENQSQDEYLNITKLITSDPGKFLHYMTKNEWQPEDLTPLSTANVMQQPPIPLLLPTKRVIVSHTGGKSCNSTFNCSRILQKIQAEHTASNHKDIGFNFLVGGNGVVFEGRGWDVAGLHTPNNNADSIGVALIGSFNTIKPADEQIRALRNLLEWGVTNAKLDKDYKLFAQRQLHPTESPGTMVLEIIETWPHFHIQLDSVTPKTSTT